MTLKHRSRLLERESILLTLRKENPTKSPIVINLINEIDDDLLTNAATKDFFARKISEVRKLSGFTTEEVGAILKVTHSKIDQLEHYYRKDNKRKDKNYRFKCIDKFYLEAFSLLYQVSPLYLLGEVDNEGEYKSSKQSLCSGNEADINEMIKLGAGIFPMYEIEPPVANRVDYIIKNLIDNHKEYLVDFIKISDFKPVDRNRVKQLLLLSPKIPKILSCKIEFPERKFDIKFDESHILERHFISDCIQLLSSLGVRDFELLDIIAHLVNKESELKLLHDLLHQMEFISDNNSFRHINEMKKLQKIYKIILRNKKYETSVSKLREFEDKKSESDMKKISRKNMGKYTVLTSEQEQEKISAAKSIHFGRVGIIPTWKPKRNRKTGKKS